MKPESDLTEFTRYHNFVIQQGMEADELAIEWLLQVKKAIYTAVYSHSQRLVSIKDPSWSMLLSLLDRVYDHAAASVVTYFTCSWASLEVLVRVTIEAATTVLYITNCDRDLRLGQYLTHHFVSTRKAAERSDPSVRSEGLKNLDWREHFIRQVAAHEGIPLDAIGWPSKVIDRFKAVGMETEYRHLYAVLSGQAHNDADSLIDFVITQCFAGHESSVIDIAAKELQYWIRFYLYSGLRYYVIAAHSYAVAMEFIGSVTELERIQASVEQHLMELSAAFDHSRNAMAAFLEKALTSHGD